MSDRRIPQTVQLALKELQDYLAGIYGNVCAGFTFMAPLPGGIFIPVRI